MFDTQRDREFGELLRNNDAKAVSTLARSKLDVAAYGEMGLDETMMEHISLLFNRADVTYRNIEPTDNNVTYRHRVTELPEGTESAVLRPLFKSVVRKEADGNFVYSEFTGYLTYDPVAKKIISTNIESSWFTMNSAMRRGLGNNNIEQDVITRLLEVPDHYTYVEVRLVGMKKSAEASYCYHVEYCITPAI